MRVMFKLGRCVCAGTAAATMAGACASAPAQGRGAVSDVAAVRAELERRYADNAAAYERGDLAAVMRLRAPDFHTVAPDGQRRDRASMEQYSLSFMNGVRKWNAQTITIDSLRLVGDTAYVTMTQHLDRMALRSDNEPHRVETWATQRETWIRHVGGWLLWRVDQVRNQRRLVDGRPG